MAIHRLLARLGFVRLEKYGLVLTPDDRVMSTRPAVLDDGIGGRIVGWRDADLAATELGRWQLIAPPRPTAIVALPPPPKLARVMDAVEQPVAEEDDWEWQIAAAKARAAADEPAVIAPVPITPTPPMPMPAARMPPPAPSMRAMRPPTAPPPVPRRPTLPPVSVKPKTAPPPMLVRPSAPMLAKVPLATPVTTPVAQKPVAQKPVAQKPVVAAPLPLRKPLPKFIAAKTEPVAPLAAVPPASAPNMPSKHEETIRTFAAPPANDDQTHTDITIAPPKPAGTSTTRRAAARER